MSRLENELRRIGRAAAEDIFDPSKIFDLQVSAGPDADGDHAYFLEFVIDQDGDRGEALDKRLRLRREVQRRLFETGDETYPYVRILNPIAASPIG